MAAHKNMKMFTWRRTSTMEDVETKSLTRVERRHRLLLHRRIAIGLMGALLAAAVLMGFLMPRHETAYALEKFDADRASLTSESLMGAASGNAGAASRDSMRESLDGTWTLGDSASTSGDLTAIPADNPVVKALINHRDEDSIPQGFDPNHATGDDGNAYPYGQCTWWAYERRHQLGLPVGGHFGNGGQWADSARSLGYWVDNTPRAGDIAVFSPGQMGVDAWYGHVAVVENVADNGGITISESNVDGQVGPFQRTISAEDAGKLQYVHY